MSIIEAEAVLADALAKRERIATGSATARTYLAAVAVADSAIADAEAKRHLAWEDAIDRAFAYPPDPLFPEAF